MARDEGFGGRVHFLIQSFFKTTQGRFLTEPMRLFSFDIFSAISKDRFEYSRTDRRLLFLPVYGDL